MSMIGVESSSIILKTEMSLSEVLFWICKKTDLTSFPVLMVSIRWREEDFIL